MHASAFPAIRLSVTAGVTLAYWALLGWQHLHGGVPGHSFMARADMPVISNWWGALVVPAVCLLLTGRVQARLERLRPDAAAADMALRTAILAFGGAVTYGALMAIGFATDHREVSSRLFQALPVVGLLLPVYRAEYVLGFLLGLTYTFGAVLPTVIATAVALVSVLLHLTVRRGVHWLAARVGARAQ